jgi:hypothetical protein
MAGAAQRPAIAATPHEFKSDALKAVPATALELASLAGKRLQRFWGFWPGGVAKVDWPASGFFLSLFCFGFFFSRPLRI